MLLAKHFYSGNEYEKLIKTSEGSRLRRDRKNALAVTYTKEPDNAQTDNRGSMFSLDSIILKPVQTIH